MNLDPQDQSVYDALKKVQAAGKALDEEDTSRMRAFEDVMRRPDPAQFEVERPRTATLNVSPEKVPQATQEMIDQAREVGAKTAPVVIPTALSLAAGPAGGLAGRIAMSPLARLAARTAVQGVGAGAGEATRQILSKEKTEEPIKEIGKAAATGAAMNVAAEGGTAAASHVLKTISSAGREATDFLGRLSRGTTKTLKDVPLKEVAKGTPQADEVIAYGQRISDTMKESTRTLGKEVEKAIQYADKRTPTGAVPVVKLRQMLDNFSAERGLYKIVPGKAQPLVKPVAEARTAVDALSQGAEDASISYRQLNDLIDQIDSATSFDPANFGDETAAKAAKKQLQVLTGRMRDLFPKGVREAKAKLASLVDTSEAISNELGVVKGQKVGMADVGALAKKLSKMLKQTSVEAEALDTALKRMGNLEETAATGRNLAARQQLTSEPSGDSPGIGGIVARAIQAVTAPWARSAAPYSSKPLGLVEALAGKLPTPGGVVTRAAAPLVTALTRKREKQR